MRHARLWLVGLVVLPGLAASDAAKPIDNPQYQVWSAWREGATLTLKTEVVADGKVQTTVTQTQTLKKVSPDKVVVEVSSATEAGGETFKTDPVSTDIPAKIPTFDAPKGTPKEIPKDAAKDAPNYKRTEGKETLTVKDKKLNCEWTRIEAEGGVVSTMWVCDDVPGRLVKSVSTYPGGSSTTLLVEWTATRK
jgi:hypothetical protein